MARPWRTDGSVERFIDASPDKVYNRVADVAGTSSSSLECRSCEWLPGAAPGAVGSQFRGRNRYRLVRWSRVCEVVIADPSEAFAFRTVPERIDISRRGSTTWGYRLTPQGSGTLVTHYYEITQPPLRPFKKVYGLLFPHHRDMRSHMAHTLEVLKAELEQTSVTS